METIRPDPAARSFRGWAAPAGLYALALALRLIPAIFYPGIDHPDEIFQSLEQAHRLVFGYGAVPWEFEYGARSWLLPGMLAGPMWLGGLFGGPEIYLASVHLSLALLASGIVLCAYYWGANRFGFWGGAIAALLPALWPDDVYFAARSLSECVAAPFLVFALYLAEPGYRVSSGRRLLLAGIFLGLAVALRLQLAPAAAVLLIWMAFTGEWRRLVPVLAGLFIALALDGALDAFTWGYPFAPLWRNLSYNMLYGIGDSFGTEPWYAYAGLLFQLWGGAIVVILALALTGARFLPAPFLAALALLAAHSAVPHKELRFIYPAILLLTISAGMGLAWLAARIAERYRITPSRIAAVALALTALCAGSLAASPAYRNLWQAGHDMLRADLFVAKLDAVCGIGLWGAYGGAVDFHRQAPFYWTDDPADFEKYLPAFNTLIAAAPVPPAPGFTPLRCFGETCVEQRQGPCAGMPMPPMPRPQNLPATQD